MISQDDEFQSLGIHHKPMIEQYVRGFSPFSDFNFVSLWSWNIDGNAAFMFADKNLVMRFNDYLTGEPFYTFLGHTNVTETAKHLLDLADRSGAMPILQLVPETTALAIDTEHLCVEEDRDHHDYIYAVSDLSVPVGGKYQHFRQMIHKFKRVHPNAHIEIINLTDKDSQIAILNLLNTWEENKKIMAPDSDLTHERCALQRLFDSAHEHNLIVIGLFLDGEMLGFSIEEVIDKNFAMGHFWKCDTSYPGIYEYLIHEKARHFETLGIQFINYEQDLGLPALRNSKMSLRPRYFLKKYIISRKGVAVPLEEDAGSQLVV